MLEDERISIFRSVLVGISALSPLAIFLFSDYDILSVDFPILVGLVIQAYIGFSSFMLVQSYEPKEKNKSHHRLYHFLVSPRCLLFVG